jgi:hypothetical protein
VLRESSLGFGVANKCWQPYSCGMPLEVTSSMLDALKQIREKKKFVEEDFYPGAPTEEIRVRCEKNANDFLDDFIAALRRGASKYDLFARYELLSESFEHEDTEEREKIDDYVGEMMRAIGIDDWTDFV